MRPGAPLAPMTGEARRRQQRVDAARQIPRQHHSPVSAASAPPPPPPPAAPRPPPPASGPTPTTPNSPRHPPPTETNSAAPHSAKSTREGANSTVERRMMIPSLRVSRPPQAGPPGPHCVGVWESVTWLRVFFVGFQQGCAKSEGTARGRLPTPTSHTFPSGRRNGNGGPPPGGKLAGCLAEGVLGTAPGGGRWLHPGRGPGVDALARSRAQPAQRH